MLEERNIYCCFLGERTSKLSVIKESVKEGSACLERIPTLNNIQRASWLVVCISVLRHGSIALDVNKSSVHIFSKHPFFSKQNPPFPEFSHPPENALTYPLSKLDMKSLCGPSGKKLVIRNQFVFWLSRGPLLVPTAYLNTSCPVLVACSSGVSARRPMMVIFANEDRGAEVEKARALLGSTRRRRKEDMLGDG